MIRSSKILAYLTGTINLLRDCCLHLPTVLGSVEGTANVANKWKLQHVYVLYVMAHELGINSISGTRNNDHTRRWIEKFKRSTSTKQLKRPVTQLLLDSWKSYNFSKKLLAFSQNFLTTSHKKIIHDDNLMKIFLNLK